MFNLRKCTATALQWQYDARLTETVCNAATQLSLSGAATHANDTGHLANF